MLKIFRIQNSSVPFNPFIYFFIFLVSNILLSYFHFSFQTQQWIGLFGLMIPFLLAWLTYRPPPGQEKLFYQQEFLPSFSRTAYLLMLILAFVVRFYKLTTLSIWPTYDEGTNVYYVLSLLHHWHWQFFFGPTQTPPMAIWALWLFCHITVPSLVTPWLFSALVSFFTFALGFVACRQFTSRSYASLYALLLGFSFWPLYVGRFYFNCLLVLPMAFFVLFVLGLFVRKNKGSFSMKTSLVLGAFVGVGFLTYYQWAVEALAFGILFFYLLQKNPLSPVARLMRCLSFVFGFLATSLPFLLALSMEGHENYLSSHWAFQNGNSIGSQLKICHLYLLSVFFGIKHSLGMFQPCWGGFLNPVLGSLFFLGLLILLRNFFLPWNQFLLISLVLGLLPAFLSTDYETFRMIALIPPTLAIVVIGWIQLVQGRGKFIHILLAFSFITLDLYQLYGPYQNLWTDPQNWSIYCKSFERFRAYQILQSLQKAQGPGLVLGNFLPGLTDTSLSLATYAFNIMENPALPVVENWTAVIAHADVEPFLRKSFPEGKAYWLSKDWNRPDGGLMLWVIPSKPNVIEVEERWRNASLSLRGFEDQNILCSFTNRSHQPLYQTLKFVYPFFRGDRFLQSVYWEKMADIYFMTWQINKESRDFEKAVDSLKRALSNGFPSSHLYYRMGILYLLNSQPSQSIQSFKAALKAPMNFTDSRGILEQLKRFPNP